MKSARSQKNQAPPFQYLVSMQPIRMELPQKMALVELGDDRAPQAEDQAVAHIVLAAVVAEKIKEKRASRPKRAEMLRKEDSAAEHRDSQLLVALPQFYPQLILT